MPGGFQSQVYNQPAQGVAGDRASQNPIATFDAGPGGLIADAAGVVIGNFAWVTPPTDPNGTNSFATQAKGQGNVAGFVYNWTQGLNTVFLSDGSMLIPQGLPVALATQGDFWVINAGTTAAFVGQKAYAQYGTGAVSFAVTGSTGITQAAAFTASVAASTFSVTASIQKDIMTVTAVGSGTIVNGATISGTGINGTPVISSQLSGTPGGIGTYLISVSQQKTIASQTVSGTYGTMTVTAVASGVLAVGQLMLTGGANFVAGTTITALGTGTGNTGTYIVSNNTVVTSGSSTTAANVETKWFAASAGAPGALVKITSWPTG